jgi:uncharacterized protein
MRLLLLGSDTGLGRVITLEALNRGHTVTAVHPEDGAPPVSDEGVENVTANPTGPASVAELARGHDAIASATRIPYTADPDRVRALSRALIEGARGSGVKRLILVGSSSVLANDGGRSVSESPDFPDAWRPVAEAYLEVDRCLDGASDLDWTEVIPPTSLDRGLRTGHFRVAGPHRLTDDTGRNWISLQDFAVAFIDILEQRAHVRERIAVAY